jgi:hypothetical protein
MGTVILWCKEVPTTNMKLGPGDVKDGKVIVFANGYAEVDEDEPDFAERMSWVNTPGCPHIEIVSAEQRAIQEKVLDLTTEELDALLARRGSGRR